jgi:adenylate cyclase
MLCAMDVVRGLIKSCIPLALGVEKRNLTILFSDLENFSTHAEQSTPDALLEQMSVAQAQDARTRQQKNASTSHREHDFAC